jgi:hypothetical protein
MKSVNRRRSKIARIALADRHWRVADRALMAIVAVAAVLRFKVSDPLMIGATAIVGLIAFPVVQAAWVFVQRHAADHCHERKPPCAQLTPS